VEGDSWKAGNRPYVELNIRLISSRSPAQHQTAISTGTRPLHLSKSTCPPQVDKAHRYIFTVYALKTAKLEIPADATAALAGYMINANAIGKASFVANYGRAKPN
jgi:phosphatidylethanolamine-binding protein (PEBP) family uncharacterized protein